MSKKCAKCEKTVYPTEELKCLDKTWHKGCFRCWECGMTLNMKNYKGYDKKPYCNAHYPTTKFTAVADTPEMARLAQNTKIQSQAAYHDEFEKARGHYTAVTDDPEMMRLLKNQEDVSLVKYHEAFEKEIKGTKITVTDEPELQRLKKNQAITSQVEYKGLRDRNAEMEQHRSNLSQEQLEEFEKQQQLQQEQDIMQQQFLQQQQQQQQHAPGQSTLYGAGGKVEHQNAGGRRVGSIADYDPMQNQWGSLQGGYAAPPGGPGRQEWEETVPQPQAHRQPGGRFRKQQPPPEPEPEPEPPKQQGRKKGKLFGAASKFQPAPEPEPEPEPPQAQQQQQKIKIRKGFSQNRFMQQAQEEKERQRQEQVRREEEDRQRKLQEEEDKKKEAQQARMNKFQQRFGIKQNKFSQPQQQQPQQQQQQHYPPPQQQQQPQGPRSPAKPKVAPKRRGPVYKAMYDYEAVDDDEVSFREEDVIIDVDPIDEGWMFGTVQRTGKRGMLPANYVERA